MKKFLTYLIILTNSITFAQDVIFIKKGDPVPYNGYFFTEEKTQEVTQKYIQVDGLLKLNDSYEKSIELYKLNEDIYRNENNLLIKRNDDLAQTLYEERTTSTLEKLGWFGLGMLAVGLGALGISAAANR